MGAASARQPKRRSRPHFPPGRARRLRHVDASPPLDAADRAPATGRGARFSGLAPERLIGRTSHPHEFYGMSDAREGAHLFYEHLAPVDRNAHAVERYLTLVENFGVPVTRPLRFPTAERRLRSRASTRTSLLSSSIPSPAGGANRSAIWRWRNSAARSPRIASSSSG